MKKNSTNKRSEELELQLADTSLDSIQVFMKRGRLMEAREWETKIEKKIKKYINDKKIALEKDCIGEALICDNMIYVYQCLLEEDEDEGEGEETLRRKENLK